MIEKKQKKTKLGKQRIFGKILNEWEKDNLKRQKKGYYQTLRPREQYFFFQILCLPSLNLKSTWKVFT